MLIVCRLVEKTHTPSIDASVTGVLLVFAYLFSLDFFVDSLKKRIPHRSMRPSQAYFWSIVCVPFFSRFFCRLVLKKRIPHRSMRPSQAYFWSIVCVPFLAFFRNLSHLILTVYFAFHFSKQNSDDVKV